MDKSRISFNTTQGNRKIGSQWGKCRGLWGSLQYSAEVVALQANECTLNAYETKPENSKSRIFTWNIYFCKLGKLTRKVFDEMFETPVRARHPIEFTVSTFIGYNARIRLRHSLYILKIPLPSRLGSLHAIFSSWNFYWKLHYPSIHLRFTKSRLRILHKRQNIAFRRSERARKQGGRGWRL